MSGVPRHAEQQQQEQTPGYTLCVQERVDAKRAERQESEVQKRHRKGRTQNETAAYKVRGKNQRQQHAYALAYLQVQDAREIPVSKQYSRPGYGAVQNVRSDHLPKRPFLQVLHLN